MKYSEDKAIADIQAAARYYRNYLHDMAEKELFARAKFPFKCAAEISPLRPLKSANKVDNAANQIVADVPAIELRNPLQAKQENERNKSLILMYLNAVMDQSEMYSPVPPIRQFALNIPTYGAMIGRVLRLEERQDKGEQPVIIQSINPKCGYPWGQNCFIVRYQKTALEIEEILDLWNEDESTTEDFNAWRRAEKDSPDTVLHWVEIEYPDKRGIFIGSANSEATAFTPVYKGGLVENPYGFVTFVHKYSGWAAEDSDGTPEHLARGINDYAFPAYRVHALMKTAMAAGFVDNMFGKKVMSVDVLNGVGYKWPTMPGEPIIVPSGTTKEQIWDDRPPELNAAMIAFLAGLEQDIDDATIYDNMGGDKLADVGSGVYNSQLLGQGKLKERVPGHQIELALQELLGKALKCVLKWGPFDINGHDKISKSNINWPVNLKVSLEPQDAVMNIQRSKMGMELLLAKVITWRECRENYLKIENTSGARKERLIDEMLNSPQLIMAFGNAALQEWGLAELAGNLEQQAAANEKMDMIQQGRQSTQPRLPSGNLPDRNKIIPQDQTGNLGPQDMRENYGAKQGGMSDMGAQ